MVVGQTGNFERNDRQAFNMLRLSLEGGAAFPDRRAGRGQGTFTVDDPEIRAPEAGSNVPVHRFGIVPDDGIEGTDRRPIGGNENRTFRNALCEDWLRGLPIRFFLHDP